MRVSDIINRIEGHLILSNGEVSTDGITLDFDERMNINMSEYKRLGIRKIKCEIAENPGYPFAIEIMYYDRNSGGSNMNLFKFSLNLTTLKPIEIGNEIVEKLQAFFESKNKTHIVGTIDYDNSIYIYWSNADNSTDTFEFRMVNDYTINHFSFYGGASSVNQNAMNLTKNNPYLFIHCYSNVDGTYDSYSPMSSYDLRNLYFHWDAMESDSYICEVEGIMINKKSGAVVMKEYRINDVKLFRLTDGNQHCKIWFTNDGMNIIPL
jgi:hypothetical protein